MIVLIAAIGRNRVIGADGELPWYLPDDLRRFKALTMGTPMIMGRITFESIGRALPGRTNIVVTRNTGFSAPGVVAASTPGGALVVALREVDEGGDVMIIGGGEIYRRFFPMAGRLELTIVDDSPSGDTTFPVIPSEDWIVAGERSVEGTPSVSYRTMVRRMQ